MSEKIPIDALNAYNIKPQTEHKRRRRRRWRCRPWLGDKPSLVEVLAALIIGWATLTLTIYTFDIPGLGGSDDFCDSFYIAPDAPDNSSYPYSNTFDIHRPIDWSKAGQTDALNHYRAIGTHNSYHLKQYEGSPTYFASWWATLVREWQYDHPTLIQQLNQGWRTMELDFHFRDKAILFYHIQMWDQLSHCVCYHQCLQNIKKWSDQHTEHFPLYIILEPKHLAGPVGDDSWARNNEPTLENLLLLEQQIIEIFGDKVVTPDALRDNKRTVHENIMNGNMPSLDDMKGRVFFLLWDMDEIREFYQKDTDGLRGRAFFTVYYYNERHDQTETPFLHMDTPNPEESLIATDEGFLIRTRVNTVMEASDVRYADNLDTGSQVISFDQQYEYVWTNMKNDARCEILDEKLFGKVCKWSEQPVPY